jgi:hypothetical protein
VETNSDSNGRDYYPASEAADEDYSRARSLSQPSIKRHNLSLNIAGLSQSFQYANTASSTTLSSGAPYTDSLSSYNFDNEYFPFDPSSFPSAVPSDTNASEHQLPLTAPFAFGGNGSRQPASQPSSPARNVYPPGQNPYNFQPGRQRSTTFSGGYQYSDFGGQLANPASALPSHLSFSQIRSPAIDSPLSGSPIITGNNNGFLTEAINPETLMEDVATPLATQSNLHGSQLQALAADRLPEHMNTSLFITDQTASFRQQLSNIHEAYQTGQTSEATFTATLNQMKNDLEMVAVAPAMITPRTGTPSSQGLSVSPAPYQTSPAVSSAPPVQYQTSPAIQNAPSTTYPPSVQTAPPVSYQPSSAVQTAPPVSYQPPPAMSTAPIAYQSSPSISVAPPARQLAQINTVQTQMAPPQQISPVKMQVSQQSLLPSLPVESRRPAPLDMNALQVPVSYEPPPMVHSHSYPNGHQLPSQHHAPNTPVSASPSFVNALGVPHAPVVSSPLAAMPVSRPASPPRPFPLPNQAALPIVHSESDLKAGEGSKRPSATRTRSTSVHRYKPYNPVGHSMQSNPPSAWQSRANSPEDDEEESEDDGQRRNKRRRSSVEHDTSMTSVEVSPDVRRHLDSIFEEFLNKVCSDRMSPFLPFLDIADSQ